MVSFAYAAVQNSPVLSDESKSYLGGLVWTNSLEEGMAAAEEQNKPVLVYFWAVWCQYCEKFETNTLPDERVTKVLTDEFILVAIDLDENKEIPRKYGVNYPPYELFLDEKGNVIKKVPGYVNSDRFHSILTEVSGNYKRGDQ